MSSPARDSGSSIGLASFQRGGVLMSCPSQSVSVKSSRRHRKASLLPGYLYLLGLLLTDTQSNLELGLFIHLHGRRWLGSSRKFTMLLSFFFFFFFNVPCMQKASEEQVALTGSLSIKANHATSDKSAHLYSRPSNTNTRENQISVLAIFVCYVCERNWNKKANAKMTSR